MKHSIDTTAKLIDQVKVNLPVTGSQSPAIARIKLIAMLNAMIMCHVHTSPSCITKHLSIEHWRNTASY